MTRHAFNDVRAALLSHWGLTLQRGGDMTDPERDGRWDVVNSRTGFIVGGHFPRRGHSYQRYRSLKDVVASWDLAKPLVKARRR